MAVTIKLFSRVGPGGTERLSFQFAGDVMMGRRYQTAARNAAIHPSPRPRPAHALSFATWPRSWLPPMRRPSTWETVVGRLPTTGAYPAKRFLLQSPPVILDALRASVSTRHPRQQPHHDWQEPGVVSTLGALDGPASHRPEPVPPRTGRGRASSPSGGTKVGVVSATTVDGDFVNDKLPTADADCPATSGQGSLAVRGADVRLRSGRGRAGHVGHSVTSGGYVWLGRSPRSNPTCQRGSRVGRAVGGVDRPRCLPRTAGLGRPPWPRRRCPKKNDAGEAVAEQIDSLRAEGRRHRGRAVPCRLPALNVAECRASIDPGAWRGDRRRCGSCRRPPSARAAGFRVVQGQAYCATASGTSSSTQDFLSTFPSADPAHHLRG